MSELEKIQEAFRSGRIQWRLHAQERLWERGIWREDIFQTVSRGRIIESYETDKPFPSFLIYGKARGKVLHVLVAWSSIGKTAYVITAYEPDEKYFEADLKTRRRPKDDTRK